MKKKVNIVIFLIIIILIILGILLTIFITNNLNSSKKEIKNNNDKVINNHNNNNNTAKEDNHDLFTMLLNDSNYKEINIMDKKLLDKYNSLKGPMIYYYNIDTLKDVSSSLLFNAVTNNIKDNDIRVEKAEGNYTYGYIKKDLIDNQIENLFGSDSVKMTKDINDGTISLNNGFLDNTDKAKYHYAELIEETTNDYYFKFFGLQGEGTWSWPSPKPLPIKMISAKEYENYILITSLAIYSKPANQDVIENKRKMSICEDIICNKIIEEITVNNEHYFSVNIDDYIDRAGKIYTIFKKKKDNYYFFKNILNN